MVLGDGRSEKEVSEICKVIEGTIVHMLTQVKKENGLRVAEVLSEEGEKIVTG